MTDENALMSKKLVVTIVTVVCATAAHLLGSLESLHYAAVVGAVGTTYVGGQALIDAVGKFAAAKFGK